MNERPLSQLGVYNARPTITVNTDSYPLVSELLLSMEMTEAEGGMSSLELRLSNFASGPNGGADFAFEDGRILKLGVPIKVGAGSNRQEIFSGTITALEAIFPADGPPELTVLAEDAFQAARMTRRTKVYEDITLNHILTDLAGTVGLTANVNGLDENVGIQVQLNESDLAFARRLAARYEADFQAVGGELQASSLGDIRRAEVALALHSQLQEARVIADLADQVTQVTVTGWDPLQGSVISGNSSGAHLGPGSGRTGAAVLGSELHARPHHISHAVAENNTDAGALAAAAFDARARRFVCLEGTAEGNPLIRVGTHVAITGMGRRFDNTYYVTRATHLYDLHAGYRTQFEATCAYWKG